VQTYEIFLVYIILRETLKDDNAHFMTITILIILLV